MIIDRQEVDGIEVLRIECDCRQCDADFFCTTDQEDDYLYPLDDVHVCRHCKEHHDHGHKMCPTCESLWPPREEVFGTFVDCCRCHPFSPLEYQHIRVLERGERPEEGGEMRCSICGELTDRDNSTRASHQTFGEERDLICHDCRNQGAVYYCPECFEYYVVEDAPGGWTGGGVGSARVCPRHSVDEDLALTECDLCAAIDSIGMCNQQDRVYCRDCLDRHELRYCEGCETDYLCCDPALSPDFLCTHGCPDMGRPRWLQEFVEEAEGYEPGEECTCRACVWIRKHEEGVKLTDTVHPTCTMCGEVVLPLFDNALTNIGEHSVCDSCLDRLSGECRECGERVVKARYRSAPGDNYIQKLKGRFDNPNACMECMTDKTDTYLRCKRRCGDIYHIDGDCSCGGLYQHNYTPETFTILHNEEEAVSANSPFLGWELEVEMMHPPSTRRMGVRIIEPYEYLYAVRDGSLGGERGEEGLEIISHPLTFGWLKSNFTQIKDVLISLSQNGFRSYDSPRCGMHVHIAKRSMSDLHRLRVLRLIYDYPGLAMAVGQRGRSSPGIREFASFQREPLHKMAEKVRDNYNHGNDHYVAVNMEKATTVEFRFFRGTLNPSSFLKNLEFIHAVYMFTTKTGIRNTNEANFIDWLYSGSRPRTYPSLSDFIENNYLQSK